MGLPSSGRIIDKAQCVRLQPHIEQVRLAHNEILGEVVAIAC